MTRSSARHVKHRDSRPVYKHSFLNSYPAFTHCFHVFCSTFKGLSIGTRFRSLQRGGQKRTKINCSYVARFVVDPTVLTSLPRSNVKVLYGTTTSMGSMNMHLKDYYQVWVYLYSVSWTGPEKLTGSLLEVNY